MTSGPLSENQIAAFHRDGFIIASFLLDAEEIEMLRETAIRDHVLIDAAFGTRDATGKPVKLSLWNHPGDDIYGMVGRSRRVVDAMEQLLGDEVYHYHSKMILKEPNVGGAWEWHQDYGYWYQNGCLYPDMGSCMIAIDRATRENGCLQVLKGSHHVGRIEHGRFGDQAGADPERVEQAMHRHELFYCELEPGDAIFFHANLLHASAANTSPNPRWAMICCYNTRHNDPYKDSHHPGYTPLAKVDDNAIKEVGAVGAAAGRDFLKAKNDRTTGAGKAG